MSMIIAVGDLLMKLFRVETYIVLNFYCIRVIKTLLKIYINCNALATKPAIGCVVLPASKLAVCCIACGGLQKLVPAA